METQELIAMDFNIWSGAVSCLFILETVLVWLIETEK